MRKKLFHLTSFVVVLALAGGAVAQLDPAAVTTGHVYLFDNVSGGQAPDDSANSNTGTVMGSPIVVPGLKGNALLFNGSTDGVSIPDSANINITNGPFPNRTVLAVFKCDDVTKQEKQTIFDEGGRTRGLVIYVFEGQVYVGGWNRGEYNWNPGSWISAPINSNQWYTVALVLRDGAEAVEPDKFEMWLDGELIGKAEGGHLHNHSDNNAIGYTLQNTVFHDNDGSGDGWYFDGAIDEVWILNTALTERDLHVFAGKLWPFASGPTPADGAILESTWANLAWTPGDLANSHDVYFATDFNDVNDGAEGSFAGNTASTFQVVGFTGFPAPAGLEPGTTYYWRVDEVSPTDSNSPWKGEVWSFTVPPLTAYNPGPADAMRFVDISPTLSWSRGYEAKLHHLYLGDNPADVEAGGATYKGPVTDLTFTAGTLDFDKTYYWRIDEFDGVDTRKGDVWTFRTVPEITVHEDPNLLAWWKLDEGIGKRALDWSGHDNHVILVDPIWTEPGRFGNAGMNLHGRYGAIQNLRYAASGQTEVTVCAWVRTTSGSDQYIVSFDRDSYFRFEINGSGAGTGQVGWDVMTDTGQVDYGSVSRVDDGQWHHVTGVFDNGYMVIYIDGVAEPSTTGGRTFGNGNTRYGFIGANSEATSFDGSRGSGGPVTGEVDDIRVYNRALTQAEIALVMRGDPRYAWAQSPGNGAVTGINVAAALNWLAGDGASEHDVYFGTDGAAVINADASDTTGLYKGRQSAATYAPDGITENSGPYYWRIDEVAGDGSVVKGSVWSFSVADYVLIDDFESYNDTADGEPGSNLVYLAWVDGFDNPTANGSTMGYVTGASMETASVHSGQKSVPFQYDNSTASLSEVVHTFTPSQNWTEHGAQALSLWFSGSVNNVAGQLYVKVNGVKVSYDRDAANLSLPVWQPWNIDLASIGVNLQSVTSMAIGVEGASATGMLLLDDIRLYPNVSELITPVQPDPAGLFSDWKFDEGTGTVAQDGSGGGHDGTLYGDPQWVLGRSGQALAFDGIDDYVEYDLGGDQTWMAYSVSAWAKANALALAQYKSVFSSHTPNNLGFQMDVDGTDPGSYRYSGVVTGTHFYGPLTTEWVHLATTCDGTSTTLYYNGHVAATIDGVNLVFNRIGVGLNRNGDNFFEGIIDEFQIYDRALSPEEIAALAGVTQPFDKPF